MQGSQMIRGFPYSCYFPAFLFCLHSACIPSMLFVPLEVFFRLLTIVGISFTFCAHNTIKLFTSHELTFNKHDMHIILRFVVTFTSSSWLNSLFPILFVSTLAVASRWVILLRPTLPDLFSPMVMEPWPICCSGIVHFPLKGGIKQNLKFQVSKLQTCRKKGRKEAIPYINVTEPRYLSYCICFLNP